MRGSRTRRSVTSTWSSVCSSASALQPRWTRGGGQRPHARGRAPARASAGRRGSRAPSPTGRASGCSMRRIVLAVRAEPVVGVDRQRRRVVGDPERLPDLHDLVVEVDGARQVVQAREALVDVHAVALAREQRGERLADRPVADDQHVGVDVASSVLLRPRAPASPVVICSWTTSFSIAPRPSISTRTRSPGFSHGRPSIAAAMPDGRAGGDHVARLERARLREDLDLPEAVEDQLVGVGLLAQLAVDVGADAERVRVRRARRPW